MTGIHAGRTFEAASAAKPTSLAVHLCAQCVANCSYSGPVSTDMMTSLAKFRMQNSGLSLYYSKFELYFFKCGKKMYIFELQ